MAEGETTDQIIRLAEEAVSLLVTDQVFSSVGTETVTIPLSASYELGTASERVLQALSDVFSERGFTLAYTLGTSYVTLTRMRMPGSSTGDSHQAAAGVATGNAVAMDATITAKANISADAQVVGHETSDELLRMIVDLLLIQMQSRGRDRTEIMQAVQVVLSVLAIIIAMNK